MIAAQTIYFYAAPLVMFALGYLLGWRRGFAKARSKAEHFALDNLERHVGRLQRFPTESGSYRARLAHWRKAKS